MLGISRKVFIVAERFSVVLMQDNLAKRSMIVQLVLQVKIYFFILFRLYAPCGCTYSDTGYICDILHSNTEYQDYITAVINFQAVTTHCHNARVMESGPCD